ncbi:hypothetical protein LINGRAHAP2_LOCUS7978, partial [Linum grandiflorum]
LHTNFFISPCALVCFPPFICSSAIVFIPSFYNSHVMHPPTWMLYHPTIYFILFLIITNRRSKLESYHR